MKHVVVRYKLKADRVAEHEALIQGVFAAIRERGLPITHYRVLKLADGLSYIHIAGTGTPENEIVKLDAFKAFTAGIKERCDELPVSSDATVLAAYDAP